MTIIVRRLALLVIAIIVCLPVRTEAAQRNDAPAIASPTESFADALHNSDWDDVIAISTRELERLPPISDHNARLFRYYRGDAYAHIGLLDEAAADLGFLVTTPPTPDTLAQSRLDTVKRLIALRPPIRQDVSIDGEVRFTIFADTDDIALQKIVELAPVAANSIRSLLGKPPRRTVILLFDSAEREKAFFEVRSPNAGIFNPAMTTRGSVDGVFIYIEHKGQKYSTDPLSSGFRWTVSHEYMHVNVQRTLAACASLPTWLNEGVANVAGSHAAPDQSAILAYEFRLMVEHKRVMSLEDLSTSHFHDVAYAAGAGERNEYPYAQAMSMTTFLLLGRKEAILDDLLQAMRKTGDFDTAFQQTFGESVKDFYAEWQEYALPKKAAGG